MKRTISGVKQPKIINKAKSSPYAKIVSVKPALQAVLNVISDSIKINGRNVASVIVVAHLASSNIASS